MVITVKREHGNINKDSNLIAFKGRWVARDDCGNYLDHDKYRNDLVGRLSGRGSVTVIGD